MDSPKSASAFAKLARFAPCLLGTLLLIIFFDLLLAPSNVVLSLPGTDLFSQFLGWRSFGFGSLSRGHLPLWNPYVYGGAPYLAGFQSALFYPPNWLHLMLPLGRAFNVILVAHVLMMGVFTYIWARGWKLRRAAAVFSGLAVMLGAPFYFHLYAGHVTNICSMAWTPMVLYGLDRAVEGAGRRAVLVGGLALCMQILGGHVQYVYYTLLIGALYLAVRLWAGGEERKRVPVVLGVALLILLLGIGLSAAQIWPALAVAGETVRSGKTPYEFASRFSFPVENLLTAVAPGFFGELEPGVLPYWGKWRLWEMSAFQGVATLVLAGYFFVCGRGDLRKSAGIILGVAVLLALGDNTPLYRLLYAVLPGFASFRGVSKFIFFASLMVALLAGAGLDRVLAGGEQRGKKGAIAGFGALGGGVLLLLGSAILQVWPEPWRGFVRGITSGPQYLGHPMPMARPEFFWDTVAQTAGQLAMAGVFCAMMGAIILGARKRPALGYAALAILAAELLKFSQSHRPVFDLNTAADANVAPLIQGGGADYRLLNFTSPNLGMWMGYQDAWGNDPVVLKRYAEFMGATQGLTPGQVGQDVKLYNVVPSLRLARVKYALMPGPAGPTAQELTGVLPRALLVRGWKVLSKKEELLRAVTDPSFAAEKTVILEHTPEPAPDASKPLRADETVQVVSAAADELVIEAKVDEPAILLVTDAYSAGWKAVADGTSAQSEYTVMPGNYAFRAIPLKAGQHRIRMVYTAPGLAWGELVSGVAVVGFLCLWAWPLARRRTRPAELVP